MFKALSRTPTRLPSLSLPGISTSSISASHPSSGRSSSNMSDPPPSYPTQPYTPRHSSWPYTASDFTRQDPTPDTSFYSQPRFVTHIDDNAISSLRQYYSTVLPSTGKILEICSSWISHLPASQEPTASVTSTETSGATNANSTNAQSQTKPNLEVTGYGMNNDELAANPVLSRRVVQDLNKIPELEATDADASFDAATCVVSIDYLTQPVSVLTSVLKALKPGAAVHLVISNRCFPTKAVARWLRVDEQERLLMVADYLWFSGFRRVEVLTLENGKGGSWLRGRDPLWVVRGVRPAVAGN